MICGVIVTRILDELDLSPFLSERIYPALSIKSQICVIPKEVCKYVIFRVTMRIQATVLIWKQEMKTVQRWHYNNVEI